MNGKTQITLQQAIQKIFGDRLECIDSRPIEWGIFTPYKVKNNKLSQQILYFKLLKVSAKLQTSQEIRHNIKKKLKHLIHKVQFYEVERDYNNWYYLLKAQENLISIQSYIQIKRKAEQLIKKEYIINFLSFASQIQDIDQFRDGTFKLGEIGINLEGDFMLANYELYFVAKGEQNQKIKDSQDLNIRQILCRLLTPHIAKTDLIQLYSHVKQNYGKEIFDLVDNYIIKQQLKASEIMQTHYTEPAENTILETTISDSFVSGQVMSQQVNTTFQKAISLDEGLLSGKDSKSKKKNKKLIVFSLMFVAILMVIGGFTLMYLTPRPLQCSQSQYEDKAQNICISCDNSCQSCSGSGPQACISCKDNLYIVKISRKDKIGKCSPICTGLKFQNVCIISN